MSDRLRVAFALTGSFCTFDKALNQIRFFRHMGAEVIPVMSYNAFKTDTRFGKAVDYIKKIEEMCSRKIISDIVSAEPLGPKNLADVMLVLPCTGNTVSKLKNGIYDTPVTLGVKSHLRNEKPVVIGISTNDALSTTAKNIGELLNYRNYYFIPLEQDDCVKKPKSIVCDFNKAYDTVTAALEGRQIQPLFS